MKKTQNKNAKMPPGKSAKGNAGLAKNKSPARPSAPAISIPPIRETGGTANSAAAPDPTKLAIATFIDRKGGEQKVGWSVREEKIEQFVSEEKFDTQQDAKEVGKEWLATYAQADDAERRRMLGWKTASPGTAVAGTSNERMGTTTSATEATAKKKKLSGLDGAALILAESTEPMRCQALVDAMLTRGLWKTSGKTPAATLYSAILREINEKGPTSRFKKTNRGLFTRNGTSE